MAENRKGKALIELAALLFAGFVSEEIINQVENAVKVERSKKGEGVKKDG